MKFIKNAKSIVIIFEGLSLIFLWIYLNCYCPSEIILHKTWGTPDSLSTTNYIFYKGVQYFVLYLFCTCILVPFLQKYFLKIFPYFVILGLYVFNALTITILSINIENIFIGIVARLILFFVPIVTIYIVSCIVMQLVYDTKK